MRNPVFRANFFGIHKYILIALNVRNRKWLLRKHNLRNQLHEVKFKLEEPPDRTDDRINDRRLHVSNSLVNTGGSSTDR